MKQETSLIFSVLKGEAQRPLPAPGPHGNMGWVFSVAGPHLHVLGLQGLQFMSVRREVVSWAKRK